MARIRTIKPEFFTSESVCTLSPLARLFFISLWCEADREGKLIWKPKTLKYRYLPADNCDIEELAQELIDNEMIIIYEIDGIEYCSVPSFSKHQVINNRERDSDIPDPIDACKKNLTREGRVKAEGRKEGNGKEGMERKEIIVQDANAPSPVGQLLTNVKDSYFPIYKEDIQIWEDAYPNVSVISELKKISAWLHSNPTKRKTANGMKRFINSWLSNQQNKPQPQGAKRESLKDFVFDDNFTF